MDTDSKFDDMTDEDRLQWAKADVVIAGASRYNEARERMLTLRSHLVTAERRVVDLKAQIEQATATRDEWHAKVRETLTNPNWPSARDQDD